MGAFSNISAQKWEELNDEQKMMKAKEFRADNQAYLKNTMKMTEDQMTDIDNLNVCFLATLDRINRYAKTDADKEKHAATVNNARLAQMDAIMGKEKHQQYRTYFNDKLKKAKAGM